MKRIVHRNVIPIYVAAAVWLLTSLFFPMYRLRHYLMNACITVIAFFLARMRFPDEVETVETPPNSGNEQVDQLILEGKAQQKQLKVLSQQSSDASVKASGASLYDLCGKIFDALEQDPDKLDRAKRFLNYYLPTTVTLLTRYLELEHLSGENISSTLEKIRSMLKTVETAFQKQLDNLYEADAMDITADIQVMEQIMASEGLLHDSDHMI